MVERNLAAAYRVGVRSLLTPSRGDLHGSEADAVDQACGAGDFARLDRPMLWAGRRITNLCRDHFEKLEAEEWGRLKEEQPELSEYH